MLREPSSTGGESAGRSQSTSMAMGEACHPCLSPDDCLKYLDPSLDGPPPERTQGHLDQCEGCRVMMAEAVRALMGEATTQRPAFRTLGDGERVAGRYEIRRFIARGGMGEVYAAFDTILCEQVALKTLALTATDQDRAIEGLLREVRLARKVTHPNVCRILEVGIHRRSESSTDLVPFLIMDFLDGETLAQRLSRVGRLARPAVLDLVRDLATGLQAIHRAGIVHRDFKSDNIFLVRNDDGIERAVVMDFGLARVFEGPWMRRSSDGCSVIGSAAYMAPEQIAGQVATPAADLYALGIVLFETLTGQHPFPGESPAGIALARLSRPAPLVSAVAHDIPRAWDGIVSRCLERNPARRFRDAAELRAAVEKLLDTRPAMARRWWFLVGSVLAALALASVSYRIHRGRARDERLLPAAGIAASTRLIAPARAAPAILAPLIPNVPAVPVVTPAATVQVVPTRPSPRHVKTRAADRRQQPFAGWQPIERQPSQEGAQQRSAADPELRQAPQPEDTPPGAVERLNQAQALLLDGEVARACALAEQVRAGSPELPAVYRFLGMCRMRAGDPTSARANYQRYLELAPQAADVPFVRGIVGRTP